MVNPSTITNLPAATTPLGGGDIVPVVQNGVTKNATVQQLMAFAENVGGTNGQIQYNNDGAFGGFTMSGDVSVDTSTGTATIASGAVTNAKLANMAANTVKVNASASSASPSDLSIAASQLLGRGSTGNIAAIALGAGLSMSGPTLSGGVVTVKSQSFSAGGTYTPSTGMLYCLAFAVGGGGGGGGVGSSATGGAGGGQSGALSFNIFSAATIGSSQTVTIGAAGTAGSNSGGTGGTGGTTSLGSLLTAPGGVGGTGINSATAGLGGSSGSTGTGGIVNMAGNCGDNAPPGASSIYRPGAGGSGWIFGPKTAGGGVNAAGQAATGYGAGGSGSAAAAAGNANAGGAGAGGFVWIIEFCSQ